MVEVYECVLLVIILWIVYRFVRLVDEPACQFQILVVNLLVNVLVLRKFSPEKSVGAIRAFKDLVWTTNKMKELNAIYANYPTSPAEFPEFKKTVIATMNEAKARMPSAPV